MKKEVSEMKKNVLKNLRENQELSQRELAEILGVSQQTVASWEVSRTEPNHDILQKIADLFNVSTDYLLGREVAGASISEEEKRLLSDYQSLNAEGKQTLLNVLSGLKMTHSMGRQMP